MSARRIEITLAGAGAGKTTDLARTLEDAIVSGQAEPDKVLATTFTRAAAAELAGRARTRLVSAGHIQAAHRLGAARIGTVNAVCGALVEAYAFELGLSPRLRVLDEDAAVRLLRSCIAMGRTAAHEARWVELTRMLEMNRGELLHSVAEVVAAARANGLDGPALQASADRSVQSLVALLDTPGDAEALDANLDDALVLARDVLATSTAKVDAKARATVQGALSTRERDEPLPWSTWQSLAGLKTTRPLVPKVTPLHEAAAAHLAHPRFHADMGDTISLVFELAAAALDRYATAKRERGLLDFTDQEGLALELLRLPDVAPRIAEELDLVLVDEFQDTSPIQLAIFLELAKLAKRSVWVGDPKQSIYGFRGTDPEMMDAAVALLERRDPAFVDETLAALFEQTTPRTLGTSYRSRPGLVTLTSAVFARAFGLQGIPAARVVLSPAHDDEPADLGPLVEVWHLDKDDLRPTAGLPAALAAGVHALLEKGFLVRVKGDEARTRPGTAADIAVLSRRRSPRDALAAALEKLGHGVALPREGLLDTLECRAVWAGLRRWADGRDAHAAAELSRLLGETDAEAWLDGLLQAAADPVTRRIDERRARVGSAGVRTIVEHVTDALDLRTACRRWGDADGRLANLDAFFDLVDGVIERAQTEHGAATLPGLLAALEESRAEAPRSDACGVRMGDAIEASTWHGAKGLEWPVVILHDLESAFPDRPGGVAVEPSEHGLDIGAPLHGRWIRFVPTPYHPATKHAPLLQRMEATAWQQRASKRRAQEQLRVLYVAWTRARDRLVLAGPAKTLFGKALATIADADGPLLATPTGATAQWAGVTIDVPTRACRPRSSSPRPAGPVSTRPPPRPAKRVPAFASPSSVGGAGQPLEQVRLGPATIVSGLEGTVLGDAFHAFAATDDADAPGPARLEVARRCLATWALGQPHLAGTFVRAMDRLRDFIRERYGKVALVREVPAWHRTPEGTILRGTLDAWIPRRAVIDHRALLGGVARQVEAACGYGGQLEAYARIAKASEGVDVDRWVHLPMAGLMVRLR